MGKVSKEHYLPVVIWAALIIIVSSIPDLSTPRFGSGVLDKAAHFIEYFILGLLTARAVGGFTPKLWSIFWISSIFAALFGILDETHQLLVPGRSMDGLDIAADVLGSILASAIFVRYIRNRSATAV